MIYLDPFKTSIAILFNYDKYENQLIYFMSNIYSVQPIQNETGFCLWKINVLKYTISFSFYVRVLQHYNFMCVFMYCVVWLYFPLIKLKK